MTGRELRIIYMGTPDFAVAPLRALVEGGYNVVAVVTAPDKPAGRGLKLNESAVKKYAVSVGLPLLQPEKLKAPEFTEQFGSYDPDLCIVVAFRMLPEVIWSKPRLGTFNLHASLLPQYRGAAPINWAIINGETVSGVTTFFLNSKIDEGAIIARREVAITDDDNAGTLHDKLMSAGAGLVTDTVEKIAAGNVEPVSQEHYDPATLKPAPKIFKETCRIDFTVAGRQIVNLVRGLSPYPAAWAGMVSGNAGEPLQVKIFGASFEPSVVSAVPGTISTDGKSFLKVACADGFVQIHDLQAAGKKRMSATDFLRGFKDAGSYRFV